MEVSDKPGAASRSSNRSARQGSTYKLSGFSKGATLNWTSSLPTHPRSGPWRGRLAGSSWDPEKGFLIYGDDRVGVVAELLEKLTKAKINVTATQAIVAGADRFGMIFWVVAGRAPRFKGTRGVLTL